MELTKHQVLLLFLLPLFLVLVLTPYYPLCPSSSSFVLSFLFNSSDNFFSLSFAADESEAKKPKGEQKEEQEDEEEREQDEEVDGEKVKGTKERRRRNKEKREEVPGGGDTGGSKGRTRSMPEHLYSKLKQQRWVCTKYLSFQLPFLLSTSFLLFYLRWLALTFSCFVIYFNLFLVFCPNHLVQQWKSETH